MFVSQSARDLAALCFNGGFWTATASTYLIVEFDAVYSSKKYK